MMSSFRNVSKKYKDAIKGCYSKSSWVTEEDAAYGAKRALEVFQSRQFPYYCTRCNRYHLTTVWPGDVKAYEWQQFMQKTP